MSGLIHSSNFRILVETKTGAHPALILTIKNSADCTTLELFIQRLYKEIVNSYKEKAVDYKI